MENKNNEHQTITFIKFLYQHCEEGFINLRFLHKDRDPAKTVQKFIPLAAIESIPKILENHIKQYNCYFGVATRVEGDGSKNGTIQIPALWVDLDLYKLSDKQKEESRQRYRDFPLKPTFVIDSGGGRYLLWILREPASKEEVSKVENLLKRLAVYFHGDESATDASRILRIPGSLNHKYQHTPPVIIKDFDLERQYNLDDFDFLAEIENASAKEERPYREEINERLNQIMECEFLKHCDGDRMTLSEPEWYAMISILARETGGRDLIHNLSRKYPGYSPKETDNKILHANNAGPATCERIRRKLFDCGKDCGVTSPAVLAGRAKQDESRNHSDLETYDDGALCHESTEVSTGIETLGDLMNKELTPRDSIIGDGLIARKDFVIFSGPQKKGKSLASLNLAINVAQGRPWLGFEIPSSRRVGIVQQEIPEESLKDRLEKMLKKVEDKGFLDRIPHLTRRGLKLDSSQGVKELRLWLEMAKVDLLIIDPLYQFHNGRENDPGDMSKVCQCLQNIAQDYSCGVLLIHHHGKPSQIEREGGDLHRGTSLLRDATDGNWTFTRIPQNKYQLEEPPSRYTLLSFEQRHILSPDPILLRLDPETLWLELVEARERQEVKSAEVVDCLREHQGEMLNEDLLVALMNNLRMGDRACREGIYRARDEGKIIASNGEGRGHKRSWKLSSDLASEALPSQPKS